MHRLFRKNCHYCHISASHSTALLILITRNFMIDHPTENWNYRYFGKIVIFQSMMNYFSLFPSKFFALISFILICDLIKPTILHFSLVCKIFLENWTMTDLCKLSWLIKKINFHGRSLKKIDDRILIRITTLHLATSMNRNYNALEIQWAIIWPNIFSRSDIK